MEEPDDRCSDPPDCSSFAPYTPACVRLAAVFLDPLLDQPPLGSAPSSVRRRLAARPVSRAACTVCPLLADCLYRADVAHDVAGFVGSRRPPSPSVANDSPMTAGNRHRRSSARVPYSRHRPDKPTGLSDVGLAPQRPNCVA